MNSLNTSMIFNNISIKFIRDLKLSDIHGWFLIEAMVAVAIFAMLSSVFVSLSVGALNPWLEKKTDARADILATEALENVRTIQRRAWNEFTVTASGLQESDSRWILIGEGSMETVDNYTRQLIFSAVCRDDNGQIAICPAAGLDLYTLKVSAVVSWQNFFGLSKSLTKEIYLSAWPGRWWQQSDWSGGDGQAVWLADNRYDSQQNIQATTTNQLTLTKQDGLYSLSGWLLSSAVDLGGPRAVQGIDWQGLIDASSSIKLQLRVAADDAGTPGVWSDWYGQSGAGTYFATSSLVSADLNGRQWLQYRAELSGSGSSTPVLLGVRVNYQ